MSPTSEALQLAGDLRAAVGFDATEVQQLAVAIPLVERLSRLL